MSPVSRCPRTVSSPSRVGQGQSVRRSEGSTLAARALRGPRGPFRSRPPALEIAGLSFQNGLLLRVKGDDLVAGAKLHAAPTRFHDGFHRALKLGIRIAATQLVRGQREIAKLADQTCTVSDREQKCTHKPSGPEPEHEHDVDDPLAEYRPNFVRYFTGFASWGAANSSVPVDVPAGSEPCNETPTDF